MFEHLAGFMDQKVHRGYFQVEIILDEDHKDNKGIDKVKYESGAFAKIGDGIEAAQNEGAEILKRVEQGRIVEGESSDDEDYPVLYVVDATNRVIAGLHVKFFDYSNERIH